METQRSTFEAPPVTPTLSAWQTLMREGAAANRSGQAAVARGLYLRALDMACALLDFGAPEANDLCDHCVAAFVVTHLNLADAYRDADQDQAALGHLCAAHRTLMALMRDEHAAPALQQAACRHSRETHTALLDHLAQHGSHPDIEAALRAGCMPFPWPGATLH